MTTSFQIRRATLEDLNGLRELWKENLLPVEHLEKHFTDFKVVQEGDKLVGAIGLIIRDHQGLIHSEAYFQPEIEDAVRPQLWERLQVVAHNFGVLKVWTCESSPFWEHYAGFKPASQADLEKLPTGFGDKSNPWKILQIREDTRSDAQVEKQLALFKQAQQMEQERLMGHARKLNQLATFIAVAIFILILLGGLYLFRHQLLRH